MSATISNLARFLGLAALTLGACVEMDDPELGTSDEEIVTLGNQTVNELCIEVSDKSNAGTTNDIKLEYLTNGDDLWSCNLSGGASRGSEACCTPTRSNKSNGNIFGLEYFYVEFLSSSSTDGVRIGGVGAYSANTSVHYGTFSNADDGIDYEDCPTNMHCASWWLDGDDHNDCWKAKLWMQAFGTSEVYCTSD